ncbi:MAG: ethanolamine ammonia-lyase subunit EutC [Desulfobulbus sp.]|nr:ethanolamine ammonia-lyase subunit EutC [Desulfobulbus sp.]
MEHFLQAMRKNGNSAVVEDPWEELRRFTDARIALGRCGASLPLVSVLNLRMAHAQARDSVHLPLDMDQLVQELAALNLSTLALQSAAPDRSTYLTRPDLGRRLNEGSRALLREKQVDARCDLLLVVGDGLSSRAIAENVVPFIRRFQELCSRFSELQLGPICLVRNCRVATGDELGELLGAKMVAMLIGERPGLSSPNSMGIYLTYEPKVGISDEARNCISNVRAGGLPIEEGVRKLAYLIEEALRLKITGVQLKDRMQADYLPFRLNQQLR